MDILGETGFDFSRLTTLLESVADPKYRRLVFEPIGVIYTASLQPVKSRLFELNLPPIPGPEAMSAFFAHFSEAETQMMSHGYGRGVYFPAFSLGSALEKALNCPAYFDSLYAIRGIGFIFTMINISHLNKVFFTAEKLTTCFSNRQAPCFFHDGVASALSFLEWNFPGFLETLKENGFTKRATEMGDAHRLEGGVYHL